MVRIYTGRVIALVANLKIAGVLLVEKIVGDSVSKSNSLATQVVEIRSTVSVLVAKPLPKPALALLTDVYTTPK